MALSMTLFAIPVLGVLGLEHLFKSSSQQQFNKYMLIALGSTAGLAAFFWLFAGMFSFRAPVDGNFPNWLAEALMDDRKALLKSSAFNTIIFILLSAGLIWAAWTKKLSIQLAALGMALLLIIDLWMINRRYLGDESMQYNPSAQFFSITPADEKILRDQDYFRVLNIENPFNDARTSYYHHSIGGYHGAKMKRYQEMIENVLGPEMQAFVQKAQEGEFDWKSLNALNMLNTKYLMAGRGENAVFLNPEANGVAWFPSIIKHVITNDEEIRLVASMDTKSLATVNESEYGNQKPGSGSIKLINRKPYRLEYEVDALEGGLVVFSEVYYPNGWKASINGIDVSIIRANYLLRGIEVPQGKSTLVMLFEPDSYFKTKNIVVIMQYLISALLVVGIGFSFYNGKNEA